MSADAGRDATKAAADTLAFLRTAVHDLKNPLHSIVLFIAALKQSDDPERIRYLIDRLDRSTRGLDGLFRRLLDLSRLDLGKVEPHFSVFDIAPLFQTLESQFQPIADQKGLKFSVVFDGPGYVLADPVMTTEILINLLSNAVRYTAAGAISLRGRREQDKVVIEVCDTGQGIDRDKRAAIFEEFVQLSPGQRRPGQGLGLGLAIVKRLAASMGTQVAVASEPGRGSVFSFALPISATAPAARAPLTTRERLKGLLVLVIDSDAYALAAMEALLSANGCFVILARTLEEAALKIDQAERLPDVLVTETRLADGTSHSDVRERCAQWLGSLPPTLLVSTTLSQAGVQRQQDSPAVDLRVLPKPAAPEDILDALAQLSQVPGAQA